MVYSYLNYSDDYVLDVVASEDSTGGKKFLFVGERVPTELSIPIRGEMKYNLQEYEIIASVKLKLPVTMEADYSGIKILHLDTKIEGKGSIPIQESHNVIGKNSITVLENILIEGRKDYTEFIKKLNELIRYVEEPFGPYADFDSCVRSQIDKGHDDMTAKKICGVLQRKLE